MSWDWPLPERMQLYERKKAAIDRLIDFFNRFPVKPAYINNAFLEAHGTAPLHDGCKLVALLERPQLTIELLAEGVPALREELDRITGVQGRGGGGCRNPDKI